MTQRMSSADVSSLYRESRTAPQHVGGIAVFEPPASGFDYERLVRLLQERITLAPRYRQRVRPVPGNLANPLWLDDPGFDITYHVRRSALPRPGTETQLLDFAGRVLARPLDRSRPLWEIYLVEGVGGGRVAIVTKTHEAMIGEDGGIDIAQVILDAAPTPRRTVEAAWSPAPEPPPLRLLRDAVADVVRRPIGLTDTARLTARDAAALTARATSRAAALVRGVASAGTMVVRRPQPSPLMVELCQHRRVAIARTALADYRSVHGVFGATVNDVALAVVTGALRGWLSARGETLTSASTVRALVPVSMTVETTGNTAGDAAGDARDDDSSPTRVVRPLLVDLPVGEPDPVRRLMRLYRAMAAHRASGRAVDAERLIALAGFAPPTLHALGARAADGLAGRMFDVTVTNVPGPQLPLYAAGARMTEIYPVHPLSPGHALSIALTSYDYGMFFGINGDRDAVPDIAILPTLISQSLAELLMAAVLRSDRQAGRARRSRT